MRKNFPTDLYEIFKEGWQWADEQMIKFWWRSRTDSPDGGTDIATLVRRALAEVCTVSVLLVFYFNNPIRMLLLDISVSQSHLVSGPCVGCSTSTTLKYSD